ncbi:MAG: hypothetical protein O3B13_19175 [Planctomycetota bacterium]|nr:hypothetical protein [Planctomycetota bacterium]MDA1165226.1 hypothetical protein [Planctomycetota bacterium]
MPGQVRIKFPISYHVIPAKAGNYSTSVFWFPACAGMTEMAVLNEVAKSFWTHF